jgi:hypothetical protein
MGMRSGSTVIDPGTRSLTIEAGMLDHGTVAAHLKAEANSADGWVQLLEGDRGDRGDLYQLTIPARYAERVRGKVLPTGQLTAVHPIFGRLGLAAWRVLETMEAGAGATIEQLVDASGVSRAQTYRAVRDLSRVRLVTRRGGRWYRARRGLAAAARDLAVDQLVADRVHRYRVERAAWRATLCERGRRDWAGLARMAAIDGPIWWPELEELQPPPDDPDPPTDTELLAASLQAKQEPSE